MYIQVSPSRLRSHGRRYARRTLGSVSCLLLMAAGCVIHVNETEPPANASAAAPAQAPPAASKAEASNVAPKPPPKPKPKPKPPAVARKPASKPAPKPAAKPAAPAIAVAAAAKPAAPPPPTAAAPKPAAPAAPAAPPPAAAPAAASLTAKRGAMQVVPQALEPSRIVVPVKIAFAAAVARIDTLVPKTESQPWIAVSHPGDAPQLEITYEIWRDPIKASFAGQTLSMSVPVHYAATVRAKVQNPLSAGDWLWLTHGETWGTKQQPQQLTATLHTKFSIADNWHVQSQTRLDPLVHGPAPAGDVCMNAGLQLCVPKSTLASAVRARIDAYLAPRLKSALEQADGQIEQALNLQAQAQRMWDALQQPLSLAQLAQANCPLEVGAMCTQPAWLLVQPSALGVSQPALDGPDLRVDLSIAGQLALAVGPRPSVRAKPFPKLEPVTGPAGFQIHTGFRLPLATLGGLLGKQLHGQRFGTGKAQLTVSASQLQAVAGRPQHLAVVLTTTGALAGQLTLSGELHYDAASKQLSVTGFDYSVAAGLTPQQLAAFDHEALRKQVAAKAHWDLGALTSSLQQAVGQALRASLHDQLQVKLSLSDVELKDLVVQADAVSSQLSLEGSLELAYTPR